MNAAGRRRSRRVETSWWAGGTGWARRQKTALAANGVLPVTSGVHRSYVVMPDSWRSLRMSRTRPGLYSHAQLAAAFSLAMWGSSDDRQDNLQ